MGHCPRCHDTGRIVERQFRSYAPYSGPATVYDTCDCPFGTEHRERYARQEVESLAAHRAAIDWADRNSTYDPGVLE